MDVILTRGLASCLILPACKSGCNRRPLSRAEIDQSSCRRVWPAFMWKSSYSFSYFISLSLHRLEFKLDNGNLKHVKSGKCVRPKGAVTDGVALGLYSTCAGHQFSFTAGGSLQHVGSKKCVNTRSGVSIRFWSSFPEIWQSSSNFLSSFKASWDPGNEMCKQNFFWSTRAEAVIACLFNRPSYFQHDFWSLPTKSAALPDPNSGWAGLMIVLVSNVSI